MQKMQKFTIGLIVSNYCGVLNRITGLYAKRGYNIDSLYVTESEDKGVSHMLIVSTGDEYAKGQMSKQLQKLHDVQSVTIFEGMNISLKEIKGE